MSNFREEILNTIKEAGTVEYKDLEGKILNKYHNKNEFDLQDILNILQDTNKILNNRGVLSIVNNHNSVNEVVEVEVPETNDKFIKSTREFIENKRIQLIPLINNTKIPAGNNWNKREYISYDELEKHKGNYGTIIGYNHKINGNSIACVDIDGFKFNENNLKLFSPKRIKECINSLTDAEKEKITLQTKEDIFNILKKAFPNSLQVKTQSGGYHIYLFNEVIVDSQHITSKSLSYPKNYKIKFLRGVSLGSSIEIFTKTRSRQCVFAGSKVNGKTYELLKTGVDDWENVETINNINGSVREALLNKGFGLGNIFHPEEVFYNTGNELIDVVSKILRKTKGEHNTCLLCLTNIISRYYDNDTTTKIIEESLDNIKDKTEEHLTQITYALNDSRANKYGIPKLMDLLDENYKNNYITTELEEILKADTYLNMDNVNIIKKGIMNEGFVNYITKLLNVIMIGDKKPFLRLFLGSYYVISGLGSVILEVVADAEVGKSFLFILLDMVLPKNTFERFNEITSASFIRMESRWNNKIIYFGDQGADNSEEKMEEILNIVKTLITEGEYTKLVCNSDLSVGELSINVDSIGALYETTHSDMNKDAQLESRKISVTPESVDKYEIVKMQGHLTNKNSRFAKEYNTAIEGLTKFKDYVKYLLSQHNNIVISHFTHNIIKYCEGSDKLVRAFNQQMNLFLAYCIFTQNECIKYNDVLLATSKQFNDFLNYIADASIINTIEYDFIQMLLAKGFSPEENVDKYFGELYDEIIDSLYLNEDDQILFNDFSMNELELLPDQSINKMVKGMVKRYGVDGDKDQVFFTVKTLHKFRGLKTYKNISNLSALLNQLYKLGFLDKLDYQRKIGNTNENIYYLTDKVKDLNKYNPELYDTYSNDEIINMYLKEVE